MDGDIAVRAQGTGLTATETQAQGQRGARLPRQSPSSRDPETAAGRPSRGGSLEPQRLAEGTVGASIGHTAEIRDSGFCPRQRRSSGPGGTLARPPPRARLSPQRQVRSPSHRVFFRARKEGALGWVSVAPRDPSAFVRPWPPQTRAQTRNTDPGRPGEHASRKRFPR